MSLFHCHCVSFSPCLSFSVTVSLSLHVSLSLSLSLFLCRCLSICVTVSLSLSLSLFLCLFLSICVTVSFSLSLSLFLCHCLFSSVTLSFSLSLSLFLCHCFFFSITISPCTSAPNTVSLFLFPTLSLHRIMEDLRSRSFYYIGSSLLTNLKLVSQKGKQFWIVSRCSLLLYCLKFLISLLQKENDYPLKNSFHAFSLRLIIVHE